MSEALDWFTTDIFADGTQKVCIRAREGAAAPLQLDHPQSQILMAILDHIAQDTAIPWTAARQAVLRGFWRALSAQA